MSGRPLNLLFLLRNLYYLRNLEAPIRALAERDHRLTILADPAKYLPPEIHAQISSLKAEFGDAIIFDDALGRRDFRRRLADDIHTARDILRYYTPPFRSAEHLRRRAALKATPLARAAFDRRRFWDAERNAAADRRLAQIDGALPVDRGIAADIARINPDVMIVTPLVDLRTGQIDWVRAARAAGTPTVLAVASWDNLTSKSRIQTPVDRVLVWNEIQRREALELHGISDDAVVVTGAQLYDDWFERQPSTDRSEFCAVHGFDPERPILLYVGSSTSISDDEPKFVARWIAAIRGAADTRLAGANLLVRPHPMNFAGYGSLDIAGSGPAIVAPLHGGLPVTEAARSAYFDALHHSDLVVGLNTSALVEASILGKGCYTIGDPGHTGGQHQTLHYRYLTAGRILHEASDLGEHIDKLSSAIGSHEPKGATAAFVREFIRPYGRDRAATPLFVDAVESAADLEVVSASPAGPVLQSLIDAVALADHAALLAYRRFRRIAGQDSDDTSAAPIASADNPTQGAK